MSVSRLALHEQGPTFSPPHHGLLAPGMEWQLSPPPLLDLMKYHLDLGVRHHRSRRHLRWLPVRGGLRPCPAPGALPARSHGDRQ